MPILVKKKIVFSDEAHFDLGGYVNKQNSRTWGTENLYAYIEKPTHSKRVTLWCRFWSWGIIGPFFIENEQGETVTVNSDRYRAMCSQKLKRRILATFGFNRTALHAAQSKLHSTFCALFLKIALSAVEDKCYADKPETIDALKHNIREAIGEIQLHTIEWNYFLLLTGRIILSNKKKFWENIQ